MPEEVIVKSRPNWVIKEVQPQDDYVLRLTFENGEEKIYDAKILLEKEVFAPLKSIAFFNQAHIEGGTVVWNDELDIAPEYLYEKSVTVEA